LPRALFVSPQLGVALQLAPVLVRAARGVVLQHDVGRAQARAFDVEVFMHRAQSMAQVAAEQAMHGLARETAAAQRVAEEVRAAQQQPDVRLFDGAGEQPPQRVLRGGFQPLVGIQQQHPRLRCQRDRSVLLHCEALPVEMFDARAKALRDRDRVVGRTRVEHDDLAAHRQHRRHASRDAVGFVFRDDDAGQGRGCRHGAGLSRIAARAAL
jgi:hypothetical protein